MSNCLLNREIISEIVAIFARGYLRLIDIGLSLSPYTPPGFTDSACSNSYSCSEKPLDLSSDQSDGSETSENRLTDSFRGG